ncbi:MAG: hypothetical protein AAF221_13145 [Pseudomonadota bacterium]
MADESEEGADVQPAEAPKRSKLPMIITLVAGLVLGGGGAAGYFMFLAPTGEPVAETAEAKAAAMQAKLAKKKPVFVDVDRVSAPLIAEQLHVVGHVTMYIRLQVEDEDDQDWVRDRLPMVRHAINLAVTRKGVSFSDDGHKVDYDGSASRIAKAINAYLKTDKVIAAHITEAVRL